MGFFLLMGKEFIGSKGLARLIWMMLSFTNNAPGYQLIGLQWQIAGWLYTLSYEKNDCCMGIFGLWFIDLSFVRPAGNGCRS